MLILEEISEFFNIIEPWLVFFTFCVQLVIFFMLFKQRIKRDMLANDILNNVLELIRSATVKPTKEKSAKIIHIEPKKEDQNQRKAKILDFYKSNPGVCMGARKVDKALDFLDSLKNHSAPTHQILEKLVDSKDLEKCPPGKGFRLAT